jgi:membrane-associated protease RseP (regulator of RpoE activity)
MKTKILALALLACVAGFSTARVYAGEEKGSAGVVSFSVHQRGGWLGVSIQDITPKLAKKKDLKNDEGAYVNDVVNDSPADSAGVKKGDVIIEFNGKTIDDADDLLRAVQKAKPGTKTSIAVMRSNEKKSLAISVGKLHRNNRSESFAFAPPMTPRALMFGASRTWGLQLSELNEQLGEYFGAPNGRGLLVEQVEKKSAGAKAGFKAGDVITKVSKNSIEELRDLTDALEDVEEGDKVEVEVLRKGTSKTLTVEIESDDDSPSSFNFNFENMPEREILREFRFNGLPADEMKNLRIQLPKSLPDMRDLKMQIEKLKEKMSQVTV